jgi:hypothetical protein
MMTEAELRERWPAAFNDQRLPLALGVHEQLGLPWGDQVLASWTRHPTYLRNVLAEGAQRIDLQGKAVSTVGPREKRFAWDRLMWVRHDLAGIAATAYARGHRPPVDRETHRAMPKRPVEDPQYLTDPGNVDGEFPIGPALRGYLTRLSKKLGVPGERRSLRLWVFAKDGVDLVWVSLDPDTHEVTVKTNDRYL